MLQKRSVPVLLFTASIGAFALPADAKPIAFSDGTTIMHERNVNMLEAQAFYAPEFWWSAGPGYLQLTSDDKRKRRDISYLQVNYLVKRWNMPSAQANLFSWAGAGTARSTDNGGITWRRDAVFRYGAQGDYETRRFYSSFKIDGYRSAAFANQISTLQLGVAPYEHDYEDLATWFLIQFRHYTGGIRDMTDSNSKKLEQTALLRLFKGPVWVELGISRERHSQFMIMYNF